MTNENFRVIIVGGGPVGLTMAHTLSKAGIDFVVLERRPTIGEDSGASIIVFPHGLRVLSQVGLLDSLRTIGEPARENRRHSPDGSYYRKPRVFSEFESLFGCYAHIFNRANLIRGIYDGLSKADRSRVFTNKVVTDITVDDSGVSVSCADGTRYDGSVVIGADGAHSVVRKYMRTLALKGLSKEAAAAVDIDEENPFLSNYQMIEYSSSFDAGLKRAASREGDEHGGSGSTQDTHGDGHSLQFVTGEKRSWVFVYERLPEPTRVPVHYTQEDVVSYAEKWGDMPLDSGLKVRDVFAQRYYAGMTNLDEGVLKRWTWGGRLVLAGDAAHKFTPNSGLGFNNGIQDAAALTNELYRALHPTPYSDDEKDKKAEGNSSPPSAAALAEAFERYQATRREDAESDWGVSAFHTQTDAWRTTLHWLWDQWVQPQFPEWLGLWMLRKIMGSRIAKGLTLNFVGGDEPFVGSLPWVNPIGKGQGFSVAAN
ncbi:FAD/NAD(P)-binding domain-containing protein [Hypoxylon sp. FL1150]|nr:FAD/NAD(P)-binding domain-containing protein [Hypoxylon sp. FL1150]